MFIACLYFVVLYLKLSIYCLPCFVKSSRLSFQSFALVCSPSDFLSVLVLLLLFFMFFFAEGVDAGHPYSLLSCLFLPLVIELSLFNIFALIYHVILLAYILWFCYCNLSFIACMLCKITTFEFQSFRLGLLSF